MGDADKDMNPSSDSTGKIDPVAIPEILSNVLQFLDPPSLSVCTRVSHLWRSCSLPIVWRSYSIGGRYFCQYFQQPGQPGSSNQLAFEDDDIEEDEERDLDLTQFMSHCHRIRSLTVADNTDHWSAFLQLGARRWRSPTPGAGYRHHPGLENLVHLDIRPYYTRSFDRSKQLQFYSLVESLLSKNPRIQHFQFTDMGEDSYPADDALLGLLRNTGPELRRLSISCKFIGREAQLLLFLIQANEQKIKETSSQATATRSHPSAQAMASPLPSAGHAGGSLEQLVLHYRSGGTGEIYTIELDIVIPDWISGSLPIRSLTLLNYDTTYFLSIDEVQDWGFELLRPLTCFIVLLERCPLLGELRFTFDISEKPSSRGFREWLLDAYPYHANDGSKNWAPAPLLFVDEMYQACPNLRSIDFGMRREFTETHWSQIVACYGARLESLSVWDVPNFQPDVFMKLMGEPLSWHATSRDHIHAPLDNGTEPGRCLTRLDISGNPDLSSCAWIVFKNLPTLKHFKALDVPLDARELIGYEWVCKGLETLEIFVLIPTQWRPRIGQWKWNNSEWVLHDDLVGEDDESKPEWDRQIDQVQGRHGAKEDVANESEDEGGYEEKFGRRRVEIDSDQGKGKRAEGVPEMKTDSKEKKDKNRKKDSSEKKDRKKKKRKEKNRDVKKERGDEETLHDAKEKKHKKRRRHDAGGTESPRRSKRRAKSAAFDLQSESDDLQDSSGSAPKLREMRPKDYRREVQIQVCKQLGRLTDLRELTLEGHQDYWFNYQVWDCLELTVETGLDRLEPLQRSLEKLVVHQLDEKLCGSKELDWIVRHWIHHRNPRWLKAQDSRGCSGSLEIQEEASEIAQDFFVPCPTFKELIGLSVRGPHLSAPQANLLLAWLQEECPSLVIEKDDRREDDDFSYGRFQDF